MIEIENLEDFFKYVLLAFPTQFLATLYIGVRRFLDGSAMRYKGARALTGFIETVVKYFT